MIKNELVKNLKKEIQDIYSKINEFENSEQIHLIDIDLARSKVRNLYELLSKLTPSTSYSTDNQKEEISTKTEQAVEPKKEKPIKTETVKEEVPVTENKKEPVKAVVETQQEETQKEPEFVIEPSIQEEEIEEDTKKEETEKQESSPEIVADKFQSKKFIHDNIAKKNSKKDVSAKMQTKPIQDINSAIGINDKFIFIRELFGGDKDQYHETIQILNNFDTYENAIEYLSENFDWSDDDNNFDRLKELVQRKYSIK